MSKPIRTLGSGLPIEERLRQAEIENTRLRNIARQMFSCISLRDMWAGNIDGDPITAYNAWIAEFGTTDDTYDDRERCSECGKPLNDDDDDLCNDCLLGIAGRASGAAMDADESDA